MRRRNVDEGLRSVARAAAVDPLDVAALERLGAELLRADPNVAVLPDPPAQVNFEDLCDDAVSAGIDLHGFMLRKNAQHALRRPDLEVLTRGWHTRMHLIVSDPAVDGSDLLALAIGFVPNQEGALWPSAGVIGVRPTRVTARRGGDPTPRRAMVTERTDEPPGMVLPRQIEEIARSGAWDATARLLLDEGDAAIAAAESVLRVRRTGLWTDAVDSLALAIRRTVYSLGPAAGHPWSGTSVMSREEFERLGRALVPAIDAGAELSRWETARRPGNTFASVTHLSMGWQRGTIPDSPAARAAGAVGAVPLKFSVFGGRVLDTSGRRDHHGGEAAAAFCRSTAPSKGERRCGFLEGPAEEVLPDALRWSAVMDRRHEYFRRTGPGQYGEPL
jgi:hypothetical protein